MLQGCLSLRCLLVVRSTCYIAHYALASSLTSPGLFLSGPLRGNAESGGPTFSPERSDGRGYPGCECRALSVELRAQASLCYIDSRKDRLFLHRRGYTGDEASLYSNRRQSNFAGQARHYGALVGAHETRRASNTEQRSKDDIWGEARWPSDS
jgi:hypothetical protein